MNGESLKAIEFYGFMALAAWLLYSQFIAARRERFGSKDRSTPPESNGGAEPTETRDPPGV